VSVRLLVVVGARPNFVKVAPILHALREASVDAQLMHTGQHYDYALCESFLDKLDFPEPDFRLGVGSASHAKQTAAVMVGCEEVLSEHRFDAVLVPGDVNSTLGAALAAAKLMCPVMHLEAGLRSGDDSMPEEINRVLTDRLAALLLCHCEDAVHNLATEGIAGESVQMVGNTMIDSLLRLRDPQRSLRTLAEHSLRQDEYVLVTLHRPATVDDGSRLRGVMEVLAELARELTVVFPVHPRTRARIEREQIAVSERLVLLEPLDYLQFIDLESRARLVITDSGGVQEETSALGVPCITYRANTERPVTISLGTNELVGVDPDALRAACRRRLGTPPSNGLEQIPLWDGAAGPRAAAAIEDFLLSRQTS
jgi:UDP-N-acetylglucosamine 2-epimerase (non-hydrolysing)